MNFRSLPTSWIFFITVMTVVLLWGWLSYQPEGEIPQSTEGETGIVLLDRLPILKSRDGLISCEFQRMGTLFQIKLDTTLQKAAAAIAEIDLLLKSLEKRISSWVPASEVSKINNKAGISPVKISGPVLELLKLSKTIHRETEGAFDITIGPVWDLWPFANRYDPLPTQRQIDDKLQLVNSLLLHLNKEKSSAYLSKKEMKINLGGIGKGYACKKILDLLKRKGISRAAIDAGGDLYLLGKKYLGPWIVEIEDPRNEGPFLERFLVSDLSVATSSDSKRFVVRNQKRYGHILDPRTGYPSSDLRSVTILSEDPIRADAYATAAFVMGSNQGLKWIETLPNVEGLLIDHRGEVYRSSGFSKRVQPISKQESPAPRKVSATKIHRPKTFPIPHADWKSIASSKLESSSPKLRQVSSQPGGHSSEKTWIDRTEVSNKQYRSFLLSDSARTHRFCHSSEPAEKDHTPLYWKEFRSKLFRESSSSKLAPFQENTFRHDDHPVVGVDWWDAYAYALWAGKHLPTSRQWEQAAQSTRDSHWPWGDQWDYRKANTGGEKWGEKDGFIYSAPVESFKEGQTADEVLQMAGNVAEWTLDGFVAGGSSRSNPTEVSTKSRQLRRAGYRSFEIGFRCAYTGELP